MTIAVVKQSYNESLCQRRYYGEAILALLRLGMIGSICTLIDVRKKPSKQGCVLLGRMLRMPTRKPWLVSFFTSISFLGPSENLFFSAWIG